MEGLSGHGRSVGSMLCYYVSSFIIFLGVFRGLVFKKAMSGFFLSLSSHQNGPPLHAQVDLG